jgi:hypothetical protein
MLPKSSRFTEAAAAPCPSEGPDAVASGCSSLTAFSDGGVRHAQPPKSAASDMAAMTARTRMIRDNRIEFATCPLQGAAP